MRIWILKKVIIMKILENIKNQAYENNNEKCCNVITRKMRE